jgi:hypothetical protein
MVTKEIFMETPIGVSEACRPKMPRARRSLVVKRTFTVSALWDEDAKVYYSESDIIGLHIEAETVEEFEDIMREVAVELVVANHLTAPEIASKPMKDLVPAILWQRPAPRQAAA